MTISVNDKFFKSRPFLFPAFAQKRKKIEKLAILCLWGIFPLLKPPRGFKKREASRCAIFDVSRSLQWDFLFRQKKTKIKNLNCLEFRFSFVWNSLGLYCRECYSMSLVVIYRRLQVERRIVIVLVERGFRCFRGYCVRPSVKVKRKLEKLKESPFSLLLL